MLHILILRELSEQELRKVRSLSERSDTIIIADPAMKVPFKNVKAYVKLSTEEKKAINYKTLNDILEFGDTIIDNRSIVQHFNISGAALWYYHKFRMYFSIRNHRYEQKEISNNLVKASSAKVFISSNSIHQSQLAIQAH